MRPLILEFAEIPKIKKLDYSLIEYSNVKNLSLIKNTEIPAITYANMDTGTSTKTDNEPTDSDLDIRYKLSRLLDTSTDTRSAQEPTDSDDNFSSIKLLMDTKTITESVEPTDSDDDSYYNA
jgi:hypothetical protein